MPRDDDFGGDFSGGQMSAEMKRRIRKAALARTGVDPFCQEVLQQNVVALNAGLEDLSGIAADLPTQSLDVEQLVPTVRAAVHGMDAEASVAAAELGTHQEEFEEAVRLRNAIVAENGGIPTDDAPDPLMTTFVLAPCWLAEGLGMGAILYTQASFPDIWSAWANGLLISGVTITWSALVGGYLCTRKLLLGGTHLSSGKSQILRRGAAWIAIGGTVIILGCFQIAVGVARVTPEWDELTFDADAFARVAQSFHALLAILLGSLTAIFAWWKGNTGFADPNAKYHGAEHLIADLREDALDDVEHRRTGVQELWDKARNRIRDFQGKARDADATLKEWHRIAARQRMDVSRAPSKYEAMCAAIVAEYRSIDRAANGESNPKPIAAEWWSRFEPGTPPAVDTRIDKRALAALNKELTGAAEQAFVRIAEAFTKFTNTNTNSGGHKNV
ncbi:MAG: hypothetical protein AAGA97_00940 [Pseudomonadota bacterium]